MKRILPLLVVTIIVTACDPARTLAQGNPAGQSSRDVRTEDGTVRVEVIARGLDHPWGMVFLPEGRMLVTERPGRLRAVARDGRASAPVQNVPGGLCPRSGRVAGRGARSGFRC